MNEGIWLGKLASANNFFTHFEPIAQLKSGSWEKLKPEERTARFPKKGIVRGKPDVSHHHSKSGSYWVFECHPSVTDGDSWSAESPERAIAFYDLSEYSLDVAREVLFVKGLKLPESMGSNSAVLLADGTYTFLRFEKKDGKAFARLPNDGIMELRRVDPSWKRPDKSTLPFFPHKGSPIGEVVASIDCSKDAEFLVRVVEKYRAALNGYLDIRQGGDITPKKLEKALSEGQIGNGRSAELEAIVERMRANWPETSRNLMAVEGMTRLLMESDEGKQLLLTAVEHDRLSMSAELHRQVQNDIDAKFLARREELASLESEIATRRGELAQAIDNLSNLKVEEQHCLARIKTSEARFVGIEASNVAAADALLESAERLDLNQKSLSELVKQRDEAERVLNGLRKAISTFILDFRREVENAGADETSELGIFAKRIECLLANESMPVRPMVPSRTPPWWSPASTDSPRIETSALKERLLSEGKIHGVLPSDIVLMDGFARAGEILLLLGAQAELSLRAYARAVAGGELRMHALDPSAIGLDDLWRVPGNSRPTAFAMAWHHARNNPNDLVIICLRDFDAAPFLMWLGSLQAVLSSDERPKNLVVTAIPSAVTCSAALGEQEITALRDLLVVLHPQADSESAKANIVLDELLPTATRLNFSSDEGNSVTRKVFTSLAESGGHPNSVRRGIKLFRVLGDSVHSGGEPLVNAWTRFVSAGGDSKSLPPSLSIGYEGLEALAVQR